ncbi:MAG TPA: hypothetical protein VGN17_04635 [Bryobacteraceae bacterium]|jgi:hypothetical protein
MTLEQATHDVTKALDTQDLEALERALEARQAAIEGGGVPNQEIVEAGDRALRTLAEWKQGLAFESARLGQVRSYLKR